MRARLPSVAAGAAFALWVALEALGLALLARSHGTPGGDIADPPADVFRDLVISVVFAAVGLLLALRRPRNAIGWLFLATACILGYSLVVTRWAIDALVAHRGSLPGGRIAAPLGYTAWVPLLACVLLVLVLFPSGRLPSRRWRWFVAILCRPRPGRAGPVLLLRGRLELGHRDLDARSRGCLPAGPHEGSAHRGAPFLPPTL